MSKEPKRSLAEGVEHIVWDWNGTLLDDVDACVDAINRMLDRRGLPRVAPESYRDIFDFPVRNYYLKLGFDLEREDWDRMAREFHADYHETSLDAGLRPGATELLERLMDRGMPMSVLSASEIAILRRMMQSRDVERFFDRVFGLSDLYAASKVDLGRRLMAEVHAPASGVLLVGDTVHDFEVAQELGCRCVLVTGGHQSEKRLRACGCDVVKGLDGILT